MTHAYIRLDQEGIDVQDCLDSVARAERRKSWLAVALTVLLAFSVGLGGVAWWRLLRAGDKGVASLLTETQARLACAEALLNRAPTFQADIVTVARREEWLRRCTERELRRAAP